MTHNITIQQVIWQGTENDDHRTEVKCSCGFNADLAESETEALMSVLNHKLDVIAEKTGVVFTTKDLGWKIEPE